MVENIGGINSSKTSRSDAASANSKRSIEDSGKGAAPESGRARESVDVELSEAVKRAEEKASYDEVRALVVASFLTAAPRHKHCSGLLHMGDPSSHTQQAWRLQQMR